jgi:hypothetical protein
MNDDTRQAIESVAWMPCAQCHGERHTRIDIASGRYLVALPARCVDKARCEAEALNRAGVAPARQP